MGLLVGKFHPKVQELNWPNLTQNIFLSLKQIQAQENNFAASAVVALKVYNNTKVNTISNLKRAGWNW
jgi:hypothetical protein